MDDFDVYIGLNSIFVKCSTSLSGVDHEGASTAAEVHSKSLYLSSQLAVNLNSFKNKNKICFKLANFMFPTCLAQCPIPLHNVKTSKCQVWGRGGIVCFEL